MHRRSNTDLCYICCKTGADSEDHVIPVSFFPRPRPKNLLKLPAHQACQGGRIAESQDYIRSICSVFGPNGSSGETIWENEAKRYYERSRSTRQKLRSSLLAGKSRTGGQPAIQIDKERFYPALEKIVRGLYRYHTGKLLPPQCTFNWLIVNYLQDENPDLLNRSSQGLSYSDVFESRYLILKNDDAERSIWWLRLYIQLSLRCCVRLT
jgi:hypothetical protein